MYTTTAGPLHCSRHTGSLSIAGRAAAAAAAALTTAAELPAEIAARAAAGDAVFFSVIAGLLLF